MDEEEFQNELNKYQKVRDATWEAFASFQWPGADQVSAQCEQILKEHGESAPSASSARGDSRQQDGANTRLDENDQFWTQLRSYLRSSFDDQEHADRVFEGFKRWHLSQ
jgi:hypothetical protein